MRKEQRLTKDSQFAVVFKRGRTWSHSLVMLKVLPNGLGLDRYGFITSRKVGKAVVRNKVKRRMREVARSTPTKPGWDLIFVAHSEAAAARYQDIEAAMKGILQRAHLLEGA